MELQKQFSLINLSSLAKLENDLNTEQTISVYAANQQSTIENENFLYKFKYYPLINIVGRERFFRVYKDCEGLKNLLDFIDAKYFAVYRNCFNAYFDRVSTSAGKISFLKDEIELFQKRPLKENTYAILKLIEGVSIHDINVMRRIRDLILYKEENRIKSLQLLLDDVSEKKSPHLYKIREQLFSSIYITVYKRFRDFLKEEFDKEFNNLSKLKEKENFKDPERTYKLYERLAGNGVVDQKYINDFLNLFGNGGAVKKIAWNKSLSFLKAFISKSVDKKYRFLDINSGDVVFFIRNNFRPNKLKVKNTKRRYYSILSIQSANRLSSKDEKMLVSIFRNLQL